MSDACITHIADTALWVATYRALESERPDALFHDKFAGLLAGERGKSIAASMPYPKIMAWTFVVRTIAIDEMIMKTIDLGVDTVVNLGAGLDTRPYRMKLPASLRWFEVDFPHIISYKNEKLANERPVCQLERISADLSDVPNRRALFSQISSESHKTLILTEGVVVYLTSRDSESLSRDLLEVPSFQYWIQDFYQGGHRRMPRKMSERLKETPFRFDAPDWLAFFEKQGWRILENRYTGDEGERIQRPFPIPFPWKLIVPLIPKSVLEKQRRLSGYVLFERLTSTA